MKKFLAVTAAVLLATTTFASAATLNVVTGAFPRLTVTGPSKVIFKLLSSLDAQSVLISSAVFDGSSSPDGTTMFYNNTQAEGMTSFVSFVYSASNPDGSLLNALGIASGSASVLYTILSATSVIASFENGQAPGVDMQVQIDVQAIPVPAAGALLLSGLGGLGLMRRRNKKA